MNIYAVRDRLIDYFMTPFSAQSDKDVLASLALTINHPESTNAIAQAPHHFEIWKLGRVQEDGVLVNHREFLADCSSLIRAGRPAAGPDAKRPAQATGTHQGDPAEDPDRTGVHRRIAPGEAPTATLQTPDTHPPAGGSHRGHLRD